MAVDTKAKRFSMLNFSGENTVMLLPDPDGTIAQADRQHFLDLYGGIAAANPSGFQVAWARGANVILQPGVTG